MSEQFTINVQPRSDIGKGASRRLRRQGLIPGIIYGAHQDPEMISLGHNDLILLLENESFYSSVLKLNMGDKNEQVILKDLQRDPAKPFLLHVDFLRVSAKDKLRTHVPLHFINEEIAAGVKMGGMASHHLSDVEVICLPGNLPEFIEVDMKEMQMGDIIQLSGLKLPEGVELAALVAGGDDLPVVSIHGVQTATEAEGEEEEEEAAE